MKSNVFKEISSDEEKRINDILERGIYEIRNNRGHLRKEKMNEKVSEHILNASVDNIDNSNLNMNVFTSQNTNINNMEYNKRQCIKGDNNYESDYVYGLDYDTNKREFNKYDNCDRNYGKTTADMNLSTLSEDERLNHLENRHNLYTKNSNFTNANRNVTSTAKSSALKNLLNEMKQNNKYLSSSEDEGGYSQKFRGIVQETQPMDQFQSVNRSKNNDEEKIIKNNDIENTYSDIDQELKDILPTKQNNKSTHLIKTDFTITDNSILLKESGMRLNTPDLMKTNTLTTDNSYTNDKELLNLTSKFIKSIDTVRSDDQNLTQLTDMHSEIKNLQNKIDGLEKKLKNSVNSNSFQTDIEKRSNIKYKSSFDDKNKKLSYNSKNSVDNHLIKKSNRYNNCISDDEGYNKNKNKYATFGIKAANNREEFYPKNNSANREKTFKSSQSSKSDKSNSSGSNLRNRSNVTSNLKWRLDYKEKFEKIKENYDSIKATLIKERQVINQLTNKNKKLLKKEENYDKLNKTHQELKNEHIKLLKKYEESELIRKEQSKLIKSMQREIDLLRGQFDENVEKNPDKIIEEYKEIKNGLINTEKIKESVKANDKVRKKSKSKSKLRTPRNTLAAKNFVY